MRASLTEHEERVRKNLELMVLSADAPLDGVDLGDLAIVPKPDEVKRLFDFLEFRTFADRLAEALGDSKVALAVGAERQELLAEVTVVESAADAVELIGSLAVLDVMPAWIGEPGRSALAGLAIVTDAAVGGGRVDPGESCVADDSVAAIVAAHGNVRSHNAKPLMRSLLDLGHDLTGLQLDTTIVAYLIDPAEAGYALADLVEKFTAFAPPASGGAAAGQLDLDGNTLERVPAGGARGTRGAPRRRPDRPPRSRRRAWRGCTATSRTRWCGCSPGWSTSASPSTATCCARSTSG